MIYLIEGREGEEKVKESIVIEEKVKLDGRNKFWGSINYNKY